MRNQTSSRQQSEADRLRNEIRRAVGRLDKGDVQRAKAELEKALKK